MRQLQLFTVRERRAQAWDGQYGGDCRRGMRKVRRPVPRGGHLHVVLRAECARGPLSMRHRRHRSRVEASVYRGAERAGLRLLRLENVGNHLHLLIRVGDRRALARFLRGTAGSIARQVLGRERGAAGSRKEKRKFWDATAYSRAVSWGREVKALHRYFDKNRLEAVGFGGIGLATRLRAKKSPTPRGEPGFAKTEIRVLTSSADPRASATRRPGRDL